ncbi:FliO/MopB family protein [Lacisediminihabitans profunda]|uniref:FliO/MopB family protein n=1 Tax=Lacisediminihabitans profunda TaxID=2594790 RepID=A0A5C8ULJ3_9MICO|nr:flagellar biosynthetic protein FliO [Lacisediminihabitans profunda]TXN29202.1 FliO/MopB family protein [Lacisediminihabitans profunda]
MESVFLALRVLLSLAAVLGVLWMLQRRLTKGARASRATKLISVVTRQVIAPKASVVVLDVDGKRFLLGVTEQSVTVLNTSELPTPIVAESAPARLTAVPQPATDPAAATAPKTAVAFGRAMADADGRALGGQSLGAGGFTTGPLGSSILSPTTWKRAAAALRQGR